MKFIAKLNKREAPYVISDEVFVLTDGKGEGILAHDNINEKTLEIFTQPQRQGTKILNYTIAVSYTHLNS